MSKRISKEELQTDPLIENYNRAAAYYNEHKYTVLSVLIASILLFAGILGYNLYSSAQEEQAQELLSIAETHYSQGNFEEAIYGNDFELTYGFDQIIEEFPRTNAGNIARYYAAVASFKLDDIETALSYMDDFKVPSGILGVAPLTFHANLYLANEDYGQAAKTFQKAANWNENEVTTPSNLLNAAKAYYEIGDLQQTENLLDQILEEYPNSDQVVDSQRLKGMIAVK